MLRSSRGQAAGWAFMGLVFRPEVWSGQKNTRKQYGTFAPDRCLSAFPSRLGPRGTGHRNSAGPCEERGHEQLPFMTMVTGAQGQGFKAQSGGRRLPSFHRPGRPQLWVPPLLCPARERDLVLPRLRDPAE